MNKLAKGAGAKGAAARGSGETSVSVGGASKSQHIRDYLQRQPTAFPKRNRGWIAGRGD